MSNANRCDACGKLYVLGTDEDLNDRPVFTSKTNNTHKRYLSAVSFVNDKGDHTNYKDLCPSCSHKVANCFSETDFFVKKEDPEPIPDEGEDISPETPGDDEEKVEE